MTAEVISLDSRRPCRHMTGEAKCLACGHKWVSVAPIGTHEFQCPECQTMRGVYCYPLATGLRVWTCSVDGCGCQHMAIAQHPDGAYTIACLGCGYEHDIEDVFP